MKRWLMAITVLTLVLAAGVIPNLAQGDQGRLRAVHASPDAPPVDVVVNDNTLFPQVEYKGISDYAPVDAGSAQLSLVPTDGDSAVLDATVDLEANTDYTLVAVGMADELEPLVLVDDNTPPAPGQARVRFVHASPDAPAVNVAVEGGQELFSDVEFKGVGNYMSVDAGTVNLEVRDAASDEALLTVPNVSLPECSVVTIYAVGLAEGDPPLEAITSTDAETTCAEPAAGATPTPGSAQTVPATVTGGVPAGRTGTPGAGQTVTRTVTGAPTTVTVTKMPTTPVTKKPTTPSGGGGGGITVTAVTRPPVTLVPPPQPPGPAEPPGGPPLQPNWVP